VFSPIAQGVLTGKYKPGQPVPEGSRATDPDGSAFIKNLLTDDTLTKVQQLQPLADAEGLTMAQLAVAWVLQNDNVATAITGGSRPEQITANAEAAGKKLSAETRAGIDSALGDAVQRDGSVVGKASPTRRLT
jgi:aryl-alcohol dehydrogenase-like predicted oxidoreductase